jgi:predicted RNA-binding protein (virulence factor B family)
MKLLIQELQTMNVQMRIITEENIEQLENMSYSKNIEKLTNIENLDANIIIREINNKITKKGEEMNKRQNNESPFFTTIVNAVTDIFVPKSQQINKIIPNGEYLVKIYIDEQTGRIAATEKFEYDLSNEDLTVKEFDEVKLTVYRRTDIGYVVIINNKHTGVLHHNEIYRNITEGDKIDGFIKKIYPKTNKIDVSTGKKGYQRVEDESSKIIRLLKENEGHLPFDDKSNPDAIYEYFQMSKKTFKMTIGNLYKKRIVKFEKEGITLIE